MTRTGEVCVVLGSYVRMLRCAVRVSSLTQRAARLFLATVDAPSLLDTVFTSTEFKRRLSQLTDCGRALHLSDIDTDVLLRYLERDARAIVIDGDIVKIVRPNDSHTIGEPERGVLAVRQMQQQLTRQVDELERRIQRCAVTCVLTQCARDDYRSTAHQAV